MEASITAAAAREATRIFSPSRSARLRTGWSRIMNTAGGVTNTARGTVRLNSSRRCASITFHSLRVASSWPWVTPGSSMSSVFGKIDEV